MKLVAVVTLFVPFAAGSANDNGICCCTTYAGGTAVGSVGFDCSADKMIVYSGGDCAVDNSFVTTKASDVCLSGGFDEANCERTAALESFVKTDAKCVWMDGSSAGLTSTTSLPTSTTSEQDATTTAMPHLHGSWLQLTGGYQHLVTIDHDTESKNFTAFNSRRADGSSGTVDGTSIKLHWEAAVEEAVTCEGELSVSPYASVYSDLEESTQWPNHFITMGCWYDSTPSMTPVEHTWCKIPYCPSADVQCLDC